MNENSPKNTPDDPDDVQELLTGLSDGTLSQSRRAELAERLRVDPEMLAEYVDQMFLEAMLIRRNRAAGTDVASLSLEQAETAEESCILEHLVDDDSPGVMPPGTGGFSPSPFLLAISWILTALSLGTAGTLGYVLATRPPERVRERIPERVIVRVDDETGREATIVAQLTRVAGAKWAQRSWRPLGLDHLTTGRRLELSEGLAEVTFNSGARVALEGPAVFTVLGENSAELASGRLSAEVPESAIGFVVETPNGPIVDFGTEFGVEIGDSNESAVHVFKGEVEVGVADEDRKVSERIRLVENQAIAVDPRTTDVTNMTADPERFVRKITTASRPCVFVDDFSSDTAKCYAGSDSHRQGGAFAVDRENGTLRIDAEQGNTYSVVTKEPVLGVGQTVSAKFPGKAPHQAVFLVVSTASAQPTGRGGGSFGLRFRRDERGLLAHRYDSSGPPRWMMDTFTVDPDQNRPVTLSIDRLSPSEFKLYFDFGKGRIPLTPSPIRIADVKSCERLNVGVEAYGGAHADSFEFDDLRVGPIPRVDSGKVVPKPLK